MGIHDGHRDRLKQQFLRQGLDGFHDINVLELLLFYSVPRRDTNELAHALLQQFGSLAGVLDAPMEELERFPGLTGNSATLLHLIPALSRRYEISRLGEGIVNGTVEAGAYLLPFFRGRREEAVYALCLDGKGKVIDCRLLFEGSATAASVTLRRVVEVAISTNATVIVLAHNHPSGLAIPSSEDERATRHIFRALQAVGVTLADHLVIADGDYVSMADNGFFDELSGERHEQMPAEEA